MSDRRNFIASSLAIAGASTVVNSNGAVAQDEPVTSSIVQTNAAKVRYCLNVSTIDHGKVDVVDQIQTAVDAGYDGIELWLPDIEKFTAAGGKLPELRKRLADAGLRVESAIAFGQWIVDDEATRKKGFEACGRDMEIIRELGGRLIAAPPSGATEGEKIDLNAAADRYSQLIELGRARDCFPQLEVWGFSKNFARLSEVLYVLAAAQDPNACVLPDIYHLYKGGSDFAEIGTLAGTSVHVLHMNDYPAEPGRDKITDADRVFPGDGIAPISLALATLFKNGFTGVLSLELFNRTYWQQDRNHIARLGLEKMKAAVSKAIAEYA